MSQLHTVTVTCLYTSVTVTLDNVVVMCLYTSVTVTLDNVVVMCLYTSVTVTLDNVVVMCLYTSVTVTLDNVGFIIDLSEVYNAQQLHTSCIQFVCLNLPALLEMGGVDGLTPPTLEAISNAYREMVLYMYIHCIVHVYCIHVLYSV